MSKFNIGDKVQLSGPVRGYQSTDPAEVPQPGVTYTVCSSSYDDLFTRLEECQGGWYTNQFHRVDEPPTLPDQISLILRQHATRDIGTTEAVEHILRITILAPRTRRRNSDPVTSHIAASAPQSGNRRLVLDAVEQSGSDGITADEVAVIHGHAKGLHRRFCELERGGWIKRNGTRPGTSGVHNTVWVATPQTTGPVL